MTMLDPRDLVMGLLSLVGAYFWYDKTRLDERVDTLDNKIDKLEGKLADQSNKHDILETKIDGLKELLDLKFEMILTALNAIEKRK